MKHSKFNAFGFGGGYYEERRQALGTGLSPRRSPKGGLRLTDFGQRLIDDIGGDSYGK